VGESKTIFRDPPLLENFADRRTGVGLAVAELNTATEVEVFWYCGPLSPLDLNQRI
jgi:hypothetical protein